MALYHSIVDLLKNNTITYKTVYNVVKQYKETGSTADWSRSGWPRTARTHQEAAAIKRMQEKVRQNSVCSMNKMAKEEGVSYSTMFRICQEKLNLPPTSMCGSNFLVRPQRPNERSTAASFSAASNLACKDPSSSQMRSSSPLKPSTTAKISEFWPKC